MKQIILLLLIFSSCITYANITGSVIQISRKLRMSYLEPLPPKDYFIDLGERDGVKAGDTLEVFRMVPVQNNASGGPWHLLRVSLAQLKILFVGESTSIGRLEDDRLPASLPAMEFPSIMLGDQIDLKTGLPFKEGK